jgi:hypothetical protein
MRAGLRWASVRGGRYCVVAWPQHYVIHLAAVSPQLRSRRRPRVC